MMDQMRDFASYFPIWEKLSQQEQKKLADSAVLREVPKGTVIHRGSMDCMGLLVIRQGQLRNYILSQEGREITLYRLFAHDICLFSAPCMLSSIQFEMTIETEKDTVIWVIPPTVYHELMNSSVAVANYTNELLSSRFSDVMWLIEQIMWKSFDKRLASFLLEESSLEDTRSLKITHEKIANHMGTAREVVTRMLRYFQNEQMVSLTRGTVELTDLKKLSELGNS